MLDELAQAADRLRHLAAARRDARLQRAGAGMPRVARQPPGEGALGAVRVAAEQQQAGDRHLRVEVGGRQFRGLLPCRPGLREVAVALGDARGQRIGGGVSSVDL